MLGYLDKTEKNTEDIKELTEQFKLFKHQISLGKIDDKTDAMIGNMKT